MSVWLKALPLTASSLSPMPGFAQSQYVRKLPVTQTLGVRRWFSLGTRVSSTKYNWLVMP